MKRAIFGRTAVALLACVAGAACSPSSTPEPAEPRDAPSATAWTRPPLIRAVRRTSDALVFIGQAEPGARVVLRSDTGPAHAAAADDRGHFEIRMTPPAGDLLLRPETQVGQDSAPSPDLLLIVDGGRGPMAILRAGGPTRRLDRAPALGAVDSDGQLRLASGQAAPGGEPIELQAGGESGRVAPDGTGRWSLVLPPSAGPDEIRVGGRAFNWPGEGEADAGFRVERGEAGWRVVWSGPGGGRQTTWLPAVQ